MPAGWNSLLAWILMFLEIDPTFYKNTVNNTEMLKEARHQTFFSRVLKMIADYSTSKQAFVIEKFLGAVRATWPLYLPVNTFLHLCCEIHSKWLHQVTHNPISGETPSARLYKTWCKTRNPGSNAHSVVECLISLCNVKVLLHRPGKYKH